MTALEKRGAGEAGPAAAAVADRLRPLHRLTGRMATAGLFLKAVLFVGFFWWAARSMTGAAALQGAVAADIITWGVFRLAKWQARGLRIGLDDVFEMVLIFLYLLREELFSIGGDALSSALTLLFFILFAIVKCAVWGARRAVESTGVAECA